MRIRLKHKGLLGTITGKTGSWFHIQFDGGVKPFSCNYYAEWEFERIA